MRNGIAQKFAQHCRTQNPIIRYQPQPVDLRCEPLEQVQRLSIRIGNLILQADRRCLNGTLGLRYQIDVRLTHDKADATKFRIEFLPVLKLEIQGWERRYTSNGFPIKEQFLIIEYLRKDDRHIELVACDSGRRQAYGNGQQSRLASK